jgi:hypothetical protein
MSAEATYDAWGWGIQYYFKCLSDDGYTSGWQSSRTYDLTGLSLGTELCFRVKAREVRPGRGHYAPGAGAVADRRGKFAEFNSARVNRRIRLPRCRVPLRELYA